MTNLTREQIDAYHRDIYEKILTHGHAIQSVLRSHSYTIGLASKGYEVITNMSGAVSLIGEMLNIPKNSTPIPGKVYLSEKTVCELEGVTEATRFGFIEITNRKFIRLLAEHLCLGWKNLIYGKIPERVYLAVAGDVNNKLPWEPGFVSFGSDLPSLINQVMDLEKTSLSEIESTLIEQCDEVNQESMTIPIEESSIQTDSSGKALALDFIMRYGGIDGDHHKTWVIDQVVRALHNVPVTVTRRSWNDGSFRDDVEQSTNEAYENWVKSYKDGEDGPDTYEWDVGIAP